MKFAVHIQAPPYAAQATYTAQRFISAAVEQGHEVPRVFFSNLGTLNGSELAIPPQDELHLIEQWRQLADQHNIELIICVSAALRHGIIDTTEAERYEKSHESLANGFTISGLGQLTEAAIESDRLITFAG